MPLRNHQKGEVLQEINFFVVVWADLLLESSRSRMNVSSCFFCLFLGESDGTRGWEFVT